MMISIQRRIEQLFCRNPSPFRYCPPIRTLAVGEEFEFHGSICWCCFQTGKTWQKFRNWLQAEFDIYLGTVNN